MSGEKQRAKWGLSCPDRRQDNGTQLLKSNILKIPEQHQKRPGISPPEEGIQLFLFFQQLYYI